MIPPKPPARPERVSFLRYLRLFRADILSAQPARLYRAWMAEYRTPFFRSFLCNDPELIERVLVGAPADFPKSERVREGLAPLLGQSVFVTNGALWARQRRIIDPAFEGGRLKSVFPAMLAAAEAAVARLVARAEAGRGAAGTGAGVSLVEIEAEASHAAADVIFRTLFSIPIEDELAAAVFRRFGEFQRSQPLLNLAAFLPLPAWMPRLRRGRTARAAAAIRRLIADLVADRARAIAAGTAPDDLATRIMTTPDPETGACFSPAEMVDQVAIFFLAGHETSASALAWALWLAAADPATGARLAAEARGVLGPAPQFSDVARLGFARDVFREALRLYPPVPMMVREARCPQRFRGREVPAGAQVVISPWHVQRHERLWARPDAFEPDRWQAPETRAAARAAWLPFSAGPRACPGAGFAMIEGPLMLALILRELRLAPVPGRTPEPVAHLTVRARDGIWLALSRRERDE